MGMNGLSQRSQRHGMRKKLHIGHERSCTYIPGYAGVRYHMYIVLKLNKIQNRC